MNYTVQLEKLRKQVWELEQKNRQLEDRLNSQTARIAAVSRDTNAAIKRIKSDTESSIKRIRDDARLVREVVRRIDRKGSTLWQKMDG